jgi:hypothetical protein
MEIKFLKKKRDFTKEEINIKPNIYWRYILYITLILAIFSCIFGLYLFMEVNKKLDLPVVNTEEQGVVKKERINKALEYFKERENKSIEILNSPSPIIDPSL